MKWQCTLIQRRLPDYPDGDLSPFWKRLVASHIAVCSECRQELEQLAEVVRVYQDHPLPDPGPAFWQDFQQELHLKLAQVNQTPTPEPQRWRIPYYALGAAAMAGIVAVALYLGPFSQQPLAPQTAKLQGESKAAKKAEGQAPLRAKMAIAPSPAPAPPSAMAPADQAIPVRVAKPETATGGEAEFSLAAGKPGAQQLAAIKEEDSLLDDDELDWDLESVVADLSKEERQYLKSKLESGR
ncbi:MAG: zf-HC2 domain-containing protein [Desulfobaccales bacterium]